ncbi:MAG: hypothetical protein E4G89_05720 [Methanothrix sp.]|nr:MAG: hypothetical protein E4G89_05720 [Methanothrix sp.]
MYKPPLDLFPGKYVLEIFAGSANFSKALHKYNISSEAIDIVYGPSNDILNPKNYQAIASKIRSGNVLLTLIALDGKSWSRARRNDGKGPGPLRNDEESFSVSKIFPQLILKN